VLPAQVPLAHANELKLKPRLFGKFRARASGRGVLRTLFIKSQFISGKERSHMVNGPCYSKP
jgi:hypothetical protein